MATTHQPLLDAPKSKISPCKALCVLLPIAAAIAGLIAIFTPNLVNLNASVPLYTRICDRALDGASCWAMVSEVASENPVDMDSVELLQIFLEKSITKIRKVMDTARDMDTRVNDPKESGALADCAELMDLSTDRVTDSVSALRSRTAQSRSDAHAWLSSVLTNHFTCMDGLAPSVRTALEPELRELVSRARAALAMVVAVSPAVAEEEVFRPLGRGFPSWLTSWDRRLLEARPGAVKANVVVAKDGSGKYKTVAEAVAAAPDNSNTRYVIYVKKGTYKENVEIGKTKKNLMLVGDGMDSTIITGSLNYDDGNTTFKSATVAAVGDGFIAQDIWFQNTAGPQKHQAVALRVGADQSVINRCRIDAYQDTLYAHSLRQFYRDCYITGTVDFIFGNAAVVFQNCQIVARKPMSGQNNMITAQGREDPNQNTATSIQNCNVIASSDLGPVKGSIKTFLGRPWGQYSRTVFMQSNLGDHIDPAGWSPWEGDKGLKTLYYGEYMNKGPGAGTAKRVNWPGYHVITNAAEARKFTVAELIQGGVWLKGTGVAYTEGL